MNRSFPKQLYYFRFGVRRLTNPFSSGFLFFLFCVSVASPKERFVCMAGVTGGSFNCFNGSIDSTSSTSSRLSSFSVMRFSSSKSTVETNASLSCPSCVGPADISSSSTIIDSFAFLASSSAIILSSSSLLASSFILALSRRTSSSNSVADFTWVTCDSHCRRSDTDIETCCNSCNSWLLSFFCEYLLPPVDNRVDSIQRLRSDVNSLLL
mmetsp:Transcript_8470/g.18974  ORF Transcript_8470/g.18974 Transcript_8470/m.18974 type:complete len:210 (+) Transcript_8470:110-739(+)